MGAAVSNLESGRPHDVLTGPIARGDVVSVRGHLAALADDAPALAVYVTLSRAALTLARERGTRLSVLRKSRMRWTLRSKNWGQSRISSFQRSKGQIRA